MKFVLPENSRNRLIKAANLIKKGFAKWETYPRKTRNAATGVAIVISGLLVPKFIFLALISSVFAGRHMYLNGELEEAANEIVIQDAEDFGHP